MSVPDGTRQTQRVTELTLVISEQSEIPDSGLLSPPLAALNRAETNQNDGALLLAELLQMALHVSHVPDARRSSKEAQHDRNCVRTRQMICKRRRLPRIHLC